VATGEDIPALRRLDDASAETDAIDGVEPHVLRRQGVLDYFLRCDGILVAEADGQVIAYALTHPVEWMHGVEKLIWIEHIGVHPEHRRKGVGLGLLEFTTKHYEAQAEQLYAEIHPLNRASIALFEKLGGELVDRKLAFKPL